MIEDKIEINLSTGEKCLLDSNDFDWSTAIKNFDDSKSNEIVMINIMRLMLDMATPNDELINNVTQNVKNCMDSLGIHPDYESHDPNISDQKLLMLMVFDALNTIKTLNHHIMMHMMVNESNETEVSDDGIENTYGVVMCFNITQNTQNVVNCYISDEGLCDKEYNIVNVSSTIDPVSQDTLMNVIVLVHAHNKDEAVSKTIEIYNRALK